MRFIIKCVVIYSWDSFIFVATIIDNAVAHESAWPNAEEQCHLAKINPQFPIVLALCMEFGKDLQPCKTLNILGDSMGERR